MVRPAPPSATLPSTSAPLRHTPWLSASVSPNDAVAVRAPATPGRRRSAAARDGSATTCSRRPSRRCTLRPPRASAALTFAVCPGRASTVSDAGEATAEDAPADTMNAPATTPRAASADRRLSGTGP